MTVREPTFPLDPRLTAEQAEQRKELVADLAARLRASRNVTRDAIVALLGRAEVGEGRALRDDRAWPCESEGVPLPRRGRAPDGQHRDPAVLARPVGLPERRGPRGTSRTTRPEPEAAGGHAGRLELEGDRPGQHEARTDDAELDIGVDLAASGGAGKRSDVHRMISAVLCLGTPASWQGSMPAGGCECQGSAARHRTDPSCPCARTAAERLGS
ncbi:hypothetical protein [Sorangium sp. So ce1099]|uniref:hypothetical protein n=1 Tax=Sorangium sp. So ce1099 TaxID=3133331 RepID=UPI003F6066FE